MKTICSECKFWEAFGSKGRCKALPPLLDSAGVATWPVTPPIEWCGAGEPVVKIEDIGYAAHPTLE